LQGNGQAEEDPPFAPKLAQYGGVGLAEFDVMETAGGNPPSIVQAVGGVPNRLRLFGPNARESGHDVVRSIIGLENC
jgi:hypothetical protein